MSPALQPQYRRPTRAEVELAKLVEAVCAEAEEVNRQLRERCNEHDERKAAAAAQ